MYIVTWYLPPVTDAFTSHPPPLLQLLYVPLPTGFPKWQMFLQLSCVPPLFNAEDHSFEQEEVTAMSFLEGLIQAKPPLKPFC